MNVYIPGTGLATQGPCDSGFHVPLQTEWESIKSIIDGFQLSETYGTRYKVYLFMPYSGMRHSSDGTLYFQGTASYYWSSSPSLDYSQSAYNILNTNSNTKADALSYRNTGLPIRPFKDVAVTPDSSWTILYQGTGTAGIYYNSTLGLISLSSDGTNWITIADKNCGATTVYNSGDALSEANCGKYYQWGNNYGFAWTGGITTSSTKINASSYGPGNYYQSSTFITGDTGRDSSNNNNLRGGVDGNVQVMSELKNAYIGEYGTLPSAYQEVEYIQSSGTQYINTGLYPNPYTKTEAKYQETTYASYSTLFGTRNGSYGRYLFRYSTDGGGIVTVHRSASASSSYQYIDTATGYDHNDHIVSLNYEFYLDNTLLKTFTSPSDSTAFPYSLYIFALNDKGTANDKGYYKLYYLKIWDNTTLVRDLVPCYRKSDSVIGLYDLVNDQFYTNSGTGTFTKGPDVN